MIKWDHKKVFYSILAAWLLINLLQSFFTEIFTDEAYYFMYGKYLAWGYFDHPPLIALMIRISSFFFDGILGVRFMTVLMQLGTLYLIWKATSLKEPDAQQVIIFFVVAGSLWMFSAYGFISTPDVPLLFFTALFLYSYKNFLSDRGWKASIFLSISMAGLVYSKYQAVLVIGLVVLSNLRLLKDYKFWLAGLFALILLLPHIFWQITNDFPSLKYHLVDRSDGFRWSYVFEFLPNQMVVFNPFILGAVIYVLFRFRPGDTFTRSLYFLIIGFIGFFWLTAFRGHVEPHWTLACSIPMIIILYKNIISNYKLKRYFRVFILPSFLLLFLFRVFLITNLPITNRLGITGKKEKYELIDSAANNQPVVFLSSYQSPSLYTYFTGEMAFPISSLDTRQTQFDLWQFEKSYEHGPAFIATTREGRSVEYKKGRIDFAGYTTPDLQTTNRIQIKFELPVRIMITGDSIPVSFTITNPSEYDIEFNHSDFPVNICSVIFRGKSTHVNPVFLREPIDILRGGESLKGTMKVFIPVLPAGGYKFGISLTTQLGTTLNSKFDDINITEND